MLSKDDQALIDLALSQKMLTQSQADEAAKAYETVAQLGLRLTLMEILREKGFLTLSQQRQLIQGLYQKGVRARVGGYEIMTRIGKGGMGTVYKARQLTMNRVVALKILRRRLASDKRYIERFQREARALAKLNHENIVQGIDVGEADGYHYFAMEFIEGTSIKEMILKEGALDESLALGIALQMARALRFAHQNGIIHRDIKPSNIILTKDGVAKLCDLGLAKLTEAQEDTSVTQPGDPVGTALFISPEQARGETNIDARADIYSLGATLYQMAVGEVPFQGTTRAATMTKHITEPLPPPKERNLALSDSTCAIIEKMMAKDRKDRYANCDEMIQDLQLAINDQPPVHAAAHLPAKPRPKPTVGALRRWRERARVAQRPTRRESFVLGTVAAILVVGGFVLFFGVGREFAPTEHETPVAMNEVAVEPESARAMLDYAQTFAAKNPRLYKDIIGKLEMIPAVAPDSPQALKARKLISEFRKRLDAEAQKAFDALKKESDAVAASDRFQAAIEVWQKFPSRCDIPEWRKRLEAEVAALRQAATAKFKDYETRALALAEQGNFDAAKTAYKDAESLGTKEVQAAIAAKLAELDQLCSVHRGNQLFVCALEAFRDRRYFQLRQLLAELDAKYADAKLPARDATAQSTLADMRAAAKEKGNLIAVKQDGSCDFTTLESALISAQDGDTIEIRDNGTYLEPNIGFFQEKDKFSGQIVVRKNITLRGTAPDPPTISRSERDKTFYLLNCGPNWTIEHIEFSFSGGLIATRGPVHIRNCIFQDNPLAIAVGGWADKVEIENCTFNRVKTAAIGLFEFNTDAPEVVVRNSVVYGAPSFVMRFQETRGLKFQTRNCILSDLTQALIADAPAQKGQPAFQPLEWQGDYNCYWNIKAFCAGIGEGASDVTTLDAWQQRTQTETRSLFADPQFVSPRKDDFRLEPASPCRRVGKDGADIGIAWAERPSRP